MGWSRSSRSRDRVSPRRWRGGGNLPTSSLRRSASGQPRYGNPGSKSIDTLSFVGWIGRRFWTFLHSLYARARLNGSLELSRRINIVRHSPDPPDERQCINRFDPGFPYRGLLLNELVGKNSEAKATSCRFWSTRDFAPLRWPACASWASLRPCRDHCHDEQKSLRCMRSHGEAEWELGTFATDKYRSSLTTSRNHYAA